jgi:FixJ family two-component response regulator
LRASGFAAELYSSAEQFLDRPSEGKIACLLLDIDLGGISGIELQQRLVEQGDAPPIIFITSQVDGSYEARAHAMGCLAFLRKPFASPELLSALNAAINRVTTTEGILP